MPKSVHWWEEIEHATASRTEAAGLQDVWGELRANTDFATYKPCVIPDLVCEQLTSARRGTYYVIKSPVSLKYLQLAPEDHFLLEQMSGEQTVREMVMAYYKQYKAFALNRITGLLSELKENGFLDERSAHVFEQIRKQIQRRSWGHIARKIIAAFFQFPIAVPGLDRVLTVLYRGLIWILFTLPVQVLFLLVTLSGIALFVGQFTSGEYDLFQVQGSYGLGLLVLLVIDVFVIVLHEGAHAFTTKNYGRDVIRGGFLIYLGMPAFFVDTTDIWLSPKRARIAVSWAGPYSELIMGGVCSWLILMVQDPLAANFLFKFAFFFYVGAFLNLNPLLELDGYYILMDWLELPMLRARSFAFVKGPLWHKLRRREKFSRQETIFTIYGITSMAYLVFALMVVFYFWRVHLMVMLTNMWNSPLWYEQALAVAIFLGIAIPLAYVLTFKLISVTRAVGRFLVRHRILVEPMRLALFLLVVVVALALPSYLGWTGHWDWHYRMGLHALCLAVAVAAMLTASSAHIPPVAAWLHWLPILAAATGAPLVSYWCYDRALWPRFLDLAGTGIPVPLRHLLLGSRWVPVYLNAFAVCSAGAILCLTVPLVSWCRIPRTAGSRAYRRTGRVLGLVVALVSLVALAGAYGVLRGNVLDSPWVYVALVAGVAVLPLYGVYIASITSWVQTRYVWGAILLLAGASVLVGAHEQALRLLDETGSLTRDQTMRRWTSVSAGELAGFLLIVAAFVHYMVQAAHLPWRKVKALETSLGRDVDRITAAFRYLALNLAASYSCLVGRWRAESVLAEAEDVAGTPIVPPDSPDAPSPGGDIVSLGHRYEEAIEAMWRRMRWVVGTEDLLRWGNLLLEHVPWQQREAAEEYVLKELDTEGVWAKAFADRKTQYLRTMELNPILAELSDEEKRDVAQRLKTERFADGHAVIAQGDQGDTFYVIERGAVEVMVRGDDNEERSVAMLTEGDYFGEIALLRRVPRTASCIARGPVEVLTLSKSDFDAAVRDHFEALGKVDRAATRASILSHIPLFRELDAAQLRRINQKFQRESFQPGDDVIRQGDVGDKFYVIARGAVEVIVRTDEGKDLTVANLRQGEYFGEIALLTDVPRTATVRATEALECLVLQKDDFQKMMGDNLGVQRSLARVSSRRALDSGRKGKDR